MSMSVKETSEEEQRHSVSYHIKVVWLGQNHRATVNAK